MDRNVLNIALWSFILGQNFTNVLFALIAGLWGMVLLSLALGAVSVFFLHAAYENYKGLRELEATKRT